MFDLATDAVVRILGRWGVCVTRWNSEEYPFASRLTTAIWSPTNVPPKVLLARDDGPSQSLDELTAVWYRRVRVPQRPEEMDPGVYDFCLREARAGLIGTLLSALPADARWMSGPRAVWAAEWKLFQLAAARRVGLVVPSTVVTNDAAEVRSAFARFGGAMIAKPARTGYVEVEGSPFGIYTSRVLAEHIESLDGVSLSPVIYQPLVEKRCDIRVTVVGSLLFAAEIDSQSDAAARVDWRQTENPALPHRRTELPPRLREAVLRLMRALGLEFGALDFILTPDGEYIFLEVNPNGQWLWLDDQLGFGISEAIAEWLSRVD